MDFLKELTEAKIFFGLEKVLNPFMKKDKKSEDFLIKAQPLWDKLVKGITDLASENASLKKKVEGFEDHLQKSLKTQQESSEKIINDLKDSLNKENDILSKAQKVFGESIEGISERLKEVEKSPFPQKSFTRKLKQQERFEKGAIPLSLSKDKMQISNMLLAKANLGGNPNPMYNNAILTFEASGQLDPAIVNALGKEGVAIVE